MMHILFVLRSFFVVAKYIGRTFLEAPRNDFKNISLREQTRVKMALNSC